MWQYASVVVSRAWPSQALTSVTSDSRRRAVAFVCWLCLQGHRRHTTAVHLLRAGVDINTIRAWLGHVSLDTTNVYAEVDLEMKAKAPSECMIPDAPRRSWHQPPGLMAFLKSL